MVLLLRASGRRLTQSFSKGLSETGFSYRHCLHLPGKKKEPKVSYGARGSSIIAIYFPPNSSSVYKPTCVNTKYHMSRAAREHARPQAAQSLVLSVFRLYIKENSHIAKDMPTYAQKDPLKQAASRPHAHHACNICLFLPRLAVCKRGHVHPPPRGVWILCYPVHRSPSAETSTHYNPCSCAVCALSLSYNYIKSFLVPVV